MPGEQGADLASKNSIDPTCKFLGKAKQAPKRERFSSRGAHLRCRR